MTSFVHSKEFCSFDMSLGYNIYINVVFNILGKVVNFVHQSMQFFRGIQKFMGDLSTLDKVNQLSCSLSNSFKKSIWCIYLHAKKFVRQANLVCVLRQLVNSTSLRQSCVILSYKKCHRLWIYLSSESESRRLTNNFYLTFINPVNNFSPVLLLTLKLGKFIPKDRDVPCLVFLSLEVRNWRNSSLA